MFKKMICLSVLCAAAVLSFSACTGGDTQTAASAEVSVRETAGVADPEAAVIAIYNTIEGCSINKLTAQEMADQIGVKPAEVSNFYVYISDPNYGLCDIMVLEVPEDITEEKRDGIRNLLLGYQDKRVAEFVNYDIFDSSVIAKNAVVFDQGDFVILLMLPDNEAAQEIIDQYVPQ